MEIEHALQDFGLTEKEAVIYTTLLQIGRASILDIARNCTLKRPTIYSGVEALEIAGLVHRVPTGKKIQYEAAPPEALELRITQQKHLLGELLPQLTAITNVPRGTKPEIRYFEGKEAVGGLYRSVFAVLTENETVDFITSMRDLLSSFPEIVVSFNQMAKKRGFRVRELMPQTKSAVEYAESPVWVVSKNPKHSVRFLPKGYDLFDSEVALFRDKVLIISFRQGIFGISIQSQHVVDTFRSIFKFAWNMSAEKPD